MCGGSKDRERLDHQEEKGEKKKVSGTNSMN
jgi:hypothetical protein